LDGSFDEAFNLSADDESTRYWLAEVQYIAVFEIVQSEHPPEIITPLADIFERIYNGEPAKPRVPPLKEKKTTKSQGRKIDRLAPVPLEKKKKAKKRKSCHLSLSRSKRVRRGSTMSVKGSSG
jgi:hypothetical protein